MQACIISTDMLVGPSALPHFMSDLSDCCTSFVQVMFTLHYGISLTEKRGLGGLKKEGGKTDSLQILVWRGQRCSGCHPAHHCFQLSKSLVGIRQRPAALAQLGPQVHLDLRDTEQPEHLDMHTMQHCTRGRQHAHLAVFRLLQVHLCAQLANGVLLRSKLGLQLAGC